MGLSGFSNQDETPFAAGVGLAVGKNNSETWKRLYVCWQSSETLRFVENQSALAVVGTDPRCVVPTPREQT